MTYWLCITTEENWKVARNKKVWGVAEKDRKKVDRLQVNDFLIFYIKQRREDDEIVGPEIKGIFKVISKPFTSQERIFTPTQEPFPWRVEIETLVIPKKPVEFRKLLPKLKFVKNRKKWYLHIQVAMRTIPDEDFDLIKSSIEERL